MGVDERKIVIWCGAAPNQKALANKLASKYNVAGIVIDEHKKASAPKKISEIVSAVIDRGSGLCINMHPGTQNGQMCRC